MSTTTTKRGAGTKFLALLASLTMMIAGLVGVALAAPASANPTNGAESNSPKDVCDALLGEGNWTWVDRFVAEGAEGDDEQTGTHVTVTGLTGNSGGWSSDAEVAAAQVHAGNTGGSVSGVPGSGPSTWATSEQDLSTLTFCGNDTPPPPPVCEDGTDKAGQEIPEGETSAWCNDTPPPPVCEEGTDKAGQEIPEGETSAWCDDTPPPPPVCTENCTTVVTEEPPAPVVEAAVVVAAPEAATVAAPAPATVAVPAAATLPAAVPAGEGSSNGLPMAALAMIALGMIGAAFAGKQLLGARK
jgi:hypothetical protein